MKEKMKQLIRVQDCDERIRVITGRKEEGPLKIQRLRDELQRFEEELQAENEKLESLSKERRRVEQEIQELEGKIEKSQIKLSNIKSNKEYTAALKEIEDLKNKKFIVEDQAIEFMEKIEEKERECGIGRDNQERLRKDFERAKTEIEKELTLLDGELENLVKESAALSEDLDSDLLKKYLFVRERKKGRAVCPVNGGVCQNCHIGIPPQQFNELIRGDSLLTCPHCNSIIYWGEDQFFLDPPTGK